jgi:hypothetical protein
MYERLLTLINWWKMSYFYGNWSLIIMFKEVFNYILSWANQSTPTTTIFTPHFSFNIILPCKPRFSKQSILMGHSSQHCTWTSWIPVSTNASPIISLFLFVYPTNIMWRVHRLWRCQLWFPPPLCCFISLVLRYSLQQTCSQTPSICDLPSQCE